MVVVLASCSSSSSSQLPTSVCIFAIDVDGTPQAMHEHLRTPTREFLVGFDAAGSIRGPSSDILQALFYLNKGAAAPY